MNKGGNFYENIVLAETQKLNPTGSDGKNPTRRLMINSVYKKAMGRNANKEDFAAWEKRSENFKQILEAARNWLYSSKGAQYLTETITRALTAKSGKVPSKDEIKQAMVDFTAKKLIYSEI